MIGEKVTIYEDKLLFKNSGKFFTLRCDVLKMVTDYKFKTTDSLDAKLIINILDEMHFDFHSRGKSLRDRTLRKNYFNKRSILASGLKTVFLSENPYEVCDELKLLLQKKRAANILVTMNEEMVVIFDKLFEYKYITPAQHKKKY